MSELTNYSIDYDVIGKSILNQKIIKQPKKHKYCVQSSLDPTKSMYVHACSVVASVDGTILFLNETDEIIAGVNPFKFSTFFRVDENNNPLDVMGDIL